MNRSIPSTGLLMPPRLSWASPAIGVCSTGTKAWLSAVIVGGSMSGRPAVAQVEERPFGADLGQVIEVVRRRRRAGRPLEGVRLPRVVAGDLPAAERDE